MLRVLDLFSGIGGFSLGLERTGGFQTVAFCEIDPFCRRVLAKHWPGVPCYDDVRTLTADALARNGIAIDIICGGFPCQDVSEAGSRAGLEGARSGLWSEYARLIGELRPRFAIVENVTGLLSLGMGRVCGDLAALGFDCFWDTIGAHAIGAPHIRERVWVVAYPTSVAGDVQSKQPWSRRERQAEQAGMGRRILADANGEGLQERQRTNAKRAEQAERSDATRGGWWITEPNVGRVAHGISNRVDRLRSLGNAVVPQIPELIGRAILEATQP